MKTLIIGLLLIVFNTTYAQTKDQRWEHARFLHSVKKEQILAFKINALNHTFVDLDQNAVLALFLEKEGVIDLEFINEKTVMVYTSSLLDLDGVKSLFFNFDTEVRVSNPIELQRHELHGELDRQL